MKKGDYLVAKDNFTRTIWILKYYTLSGKTVDETPKDTIDFIKNQKYLISYADNDIVRIYYNNDETVDFALNNNDTRHEYYEDLFYVFNLNDRKAKLIRLNKIANEKILEN